MRGGPLGAAVRHRRARRRCRASARTRAGARRSRRGSRRRARRRAARSRAGRRPTRRTAAAGGTSGPRGRSSIARLVGSGQLLGLGESSGSRAPLERAAWKSARYGCWVGCGNRVREAAEQDRRAALADRERVAPEAEREAEAEVRGRQRVRRLAREDRGRVRDADADRVERLVEPRRLRLDAAQERLGVGDRGRPGEDGGGRRARSGRRRSTPRRTGPGSEPEEPAEREARDPVDGLTVVRVAVEDAAERGRVQRERDADQRRRAGPEHARARARAASRPSPRSRAASRRSAARSACGSAAASSAAGPPWSTVSAAVTVTTRSVSTSAGWTRSGAFGVGDLDEVRRVSASCTSTRPRKRRANSGGTSSSSSRWPGRRPSPPATRSVWRSNGAPARRARPSSPRSRCAADRRGEPGIGSAGGSTTIVARAAARHERLERLAREREAQRVANGGRDVGDRLDGRRRRQHDRAFSASTTASREPYASGSRVTGIER